MYRNGFWISIVALVLIFSLSTDSHAADRWSNKWFASVGLRVQRKDLVHDVYGPFLTLDAEASNVLSSIKLGKQISQRSAIYLQLTSNFLGDDGHAGLGMMLRPNPRGAFYLSGDVGIVEYGGPYAITAGIGFFISRLTLDISGLVSGGDDGNATGAMITLSLLGTQR